MGDDSYKNVEKFGDEVEEAAKGAVDHLKKGIDALRGKESDKTEESDDSETVTVKTETTTTFSKKD